MRKSPNPNDAFIFTETQKQEFVLESVKNKNYPLLIELLTKENAEYYCTGMYSHKSGLLLALALEDFKAIACFIIHGKNIAHTYKEVNSAEEVTTVTVPKSAYITDLLFSRALLDGFLNF
ncbi:MAG: hypothetical protein NTU49_07580, partial [Gammaproteobacteria bacterium]|nr:hypothetical protein [Gammaproteobacteria bacterium]